MSQPFGVKPIMTLQEIARHAGVSASTVSRVINSVPGITASTVENVRRSMRALSYTPSPRRRGRAKSPDLTDAKVAFVAIGTSGNQLAPAYDYLLRGISSAALQRQIDLHINFVAEAELMSLVGKFTGSGFDGLLLQGVIESPPLVRALQHIPTVWLMGNRRRPTWGDQVMPDNATIGQLAAQYLLRNNHRRVAYAGISSGWWIGVRMLAFQQAIDDAGGEVLNVLYEHSERGYSNTADAGTLAAKLVEAYQSAEKKPTALFVAEDWLVRPVFNALQAAGVAIGVGQDLEVISCNNDRAHLAGVNPVPATIDIRYEAIGFRAVEQLAFLITQAAPQDRVRIMIEPQLVPPPNMAIDVPSIG